MANGTLGRDSCRFWKKMTTMKTKFTALFITNFWGVLNDNFLKTLAAFIVIGWINDPQTQSLVVSLAAGALVLPYIFCSALAGHLTQIYSKINIIRWAKIAELPIMGIAILGFCLHSVWIVVAAVFLMGLQSSLYSPAKYALIRDIGGYQRISVGMGGMEAIAFAGMLAGTVLASFVTENTPPVVHYGMLIGFALLGLIGSFTIKADETKTTMPYPVNPVKFLRLIHRKTLAYKGVNSIIYTLSVFWWLAASLQIGLIIYGKQVLGLDAFHTGLILSLAAVGISVGNVVAGWIDKKIYLLGYVAYFGWLLAVLLLVLFFVPLKPIPFAIMLFILAFMAGFFKLPLDAEIQKRVKGTTLNVVLAYFNQVSFIFILLASGTFALLTFFLPVQYLFLLLGIVFLLTPFYLMFNYRPVICFTCRLLFRLRYDVRIEGMEHLKTDKSCLILPNHQAVVDPMILFAEFYAYRIRPLVDEGYFHIGLSRRILSLFDAVCVPDLKKNHRGLEQVKGLHTIVHETLQAGGNVLFYPSGHITLDGTEKIGNRQLAYNVCTELPDNAVVLGIRTEGLWGSIWSRYGRKNTPPLIPTLLKSIGLSCTLLFRKRRHVNITIEPITEQVTQWSKEGKIGFNRHMEDYYNLGIKDIQPAVD